MGERKDGRPSFAGAKALPHAIRISRGPIVAPFVYSLRSSIAQAYVTRMYVCRCAQALIRSRDACGYRGGDDGCAFYHISLTLLRFWSLLMLPVDVDVPLLATLFSLQNVSPQLAHRRHYRRRRCPLSHVCERDEPERCRSVADRH